MLNRCTLATIVATLLCSTPLSAQFPCAASSGFSTPYDSNNGLDGIMFDVTAVQTITINCFEMNFAAGTCDPVIRHKDGTHVGSEQMPGAWTAIDSVQGIVSTGPDLPTYIPIDVNVTIAAGTTHAFYISNRDGAGPNAKYTDGTALGAVFASNTDLQVRQGTGINYPFAFNLNPRKFNGGIYYTVGPLGVTDHAAVVSISLAPNPVVDMLSIAGDRGASIAITDATGRVVLRAPWTNRVDVAALAPGTYLLGVMDALGLPVATSRFVKE